MLSSRRVVARMPATYKREIRLRSKYIIGYLIFLIDDEM